MQWCLPILIVIINIKIANRINVVDLPSAINFSLMLSAAMSEPRWWSRNSDELTLHNVSYGRFGAGRGGPGSLRRPKLHIGQHANLLVSLYATMKENAYRQLELTFITNIFFVLFDANQSFFSPSSSWLNSS